MEIAIKPIILISSTIYDFSDLRSSLKYWLTELGYDVLLSEFNDFQKSLDENSYESCLSAIAKADYFVLLIGARTGGWFNAPDRISITRMEYREALKCFREQGKPKIAVFVRQNLWDIREDRAALERYLKDDHFSQRELTPEVRAGIEEHPSRFVNDAATVFEFLREVGQADKMKAAAVGTGKLPKANWIHLFSQFSDIASALRIAFGITGDIERKILLQNLKQELWRNLCRLLWKTPEGSVFPITDWTIPVTGKLTRKITEESIVKVHEMRQLDIFRVLSADVPNLLGRVFIQQAVESGVFMLFDAITGEHRASKAHLALLEVLELIILIQRKPVLARDVVAFHKKFQLAGRRPDEEIKIRNLEVATVMQFAKVVARIIEVSTRLLQWVNGFEGAIDAIGAWSPEVFTEMVQKTEKQKVRIEDATAWLDRFGHRE